MFCWRSALPALAKVPIRASVRTTPRTRSLCSLLVMVSPSGCSTSDSHTAPAPAAVASRLASDRVSNGDVMVGHSVPVSFRHSA